MASNLSLTSHVKAFGIGIVLAVIGIAAYVQFGTSNRDAIAALPAITVYKSPTCQCCGEWVSYLRDKGFEVETSDVEDMQRIKGQFNVPRELSSCHTGVIGGYVVEGHVPAEEIQRLLQEKPEVAGITVPGMPVGSPGMERGSQRDPYNVLTFTQQGAANIYARYHQ